MSVFKKPSELQPKVALSALIYAQPGTGKTTLACSAPNAVLFDYDGGVTRIHGAHQVPTLQVTTWEETQAALAELKSDNEIASIVVDTVGKMLAYMEEYIKRTQPKMKKYDGSLSLQGYGLRKQMFINFIKEVTLMGKNVIFVAHEKEEKRGDDTVVRPEIGGSSASDLMKELDLVGYMEMIGNVRTISFDPCEKYYAKNTCNMHGRLEIPTLINDKGAIVKDNDFMGRVIDAYMARQMQSIQMSGEHEALLAEINERVTAIETADDANEFVTWMKNVKHIYNSRAYALQAIGRRTEELNIGFDKDTKKYVKLED